MLRIEKLETQRVLLWKQLNTRSKYVRSRTFSHRCDRRVAIVAEQQQHYGNVLCTLFMKFICSENPFETGMAASVVHDSYYLQNEKRSHVVWLRCVQRLLKSSVERIRAFSLLFSAHYSLFLFCLFALFYFICLLVCSCCSHTFFVALSKSVHSRTEEIKICKTFPSLFGTWHTSTSERLAFCANRKCLATFFSPSTFRQLYSEIFFI